MVRAVQGQLALPLRPVRLHRGAAGVGHGRQQRFGQGQRAAGGVQQRGRAPAVEQGMGGAARNGESGLSVSATTAAPCWCARATASTTLRV